MTRQKKEIVKKIQEIKIWIACDEEMGCGFAPADFYDPLYERIEELEEQLASLCHYGSAEEMYHDNRRMLALTSIAPKNGGSNMTSVQFDLPLDEQDYDSESGPTLSM